MPAMASTSSVVVMVVGASIVGGFKCSIRTNYGTIDMPISNGQLRWMEQEEPYPEKDLSDKRQTSVATSAAVVINSTL